MTSSGSPKVRSVVRKARDMSGAVAGTLSPIVSDTLGSLAAHAIRDFALGDGPDFIKGWLAGVVKPSEADLEKGLDTLPSDKRYKVESMLADYRDTAKSIEARDDLSDDEKKRKINELLKVYLAALPSSKSGGASADPEKNLHATLAAWSPEIHELQREWFNLLSDDSKAAYIKYMAHLAPLLELELRPYVPEKDTQKRASQLSDIEGALKGRALEQYKLWYRTLDSADRKHLSDLAKSRRLTAKIIERVLDLADVPAPKIPDFETYLDDNKIRKQHDGFIRHLSADSRARFRDFRDRLHPTVLKEKLSKDDWTHDLAGRIYIDLENMAGRMAAFNRAEAAMVLDMVEDRQLDAPPPDDAILCLDSDSAETIFQLIQSAKPKPKPTVGQVLSDGFKKFKDVMGQVDEAVKDFFPYENLSLPDFKDENEVPAEYLKRIIAEGKLDELRENSESLSGITFPFDVTLRNEALAKRLLADDKFMSRVNAKVNEFIRNWKLGKIKGRK